MKNKIIIIALMCLVPLSLSIQAAKYNNKSIDGQHFEANIWLEDTDTKYKADVVFVKMAANIKFAERQILPHILRNDRYTTLYLFEEEITNPKEIKLRQVKAPVIMNNKNSDPTKWETAAIWYMEIKFK